MRWHFDPVTLGLLALALSCILIRTRTGHHRLNHHGSMMEQLVLESINVMDAQATCGKVFSHWSLVTLVTALWRFRLRLVIFATAWR